MLKKIPPVLSPELMKTLLAMGHGDEIIIADGNYPAHSQGVKVIRADGHDVKTFLDAVLDYFPLDTYSEHPVILMEVVEGDPTVPLIWDVYKEIIKNKGYDQEVVDHIDRFDFYDRSKSAFAIIATSDKALYANILLKKGVV